MASSSRQIRINRSHAYDFIKDKQGTLEEHNLLSLTGGKYLLKTDQEWDRLRRELAADVADGNANFLVEMKTARHPLTMDVGESTCRAACCMLHTPCGLTQAHPACRPDPSYKGAGVAAAEGPPADV